MLLTGVGRRARLPVIFQSGPLCQLPRQLAWNWYHANAPSLARGTASASRQIWTAPHFANVVGTAMKQQETRYSGNTLVGTFDMRKGKFQLWGTILLQNVHSLINKIHTVHLSTIQRHLDFQYGCYLSKTAMLPFKVQRCEGTHIRLFVPWCQVLKNRIWTKV